MTSIVKEGVALASKAPSRELVEQLSRLRGEPDWLLAARLEAWDRFADLPMPSGAADEKWRRTDISSLNLNSVPVHAGISTAAEYLDDLPWALAERAASSAELSGLHVEHLGRSVMRFLAPELAEQGVVLADLSGAAREHPEIARRYLASVLPIDNKLEAASKALFTGGVFVYVPAGVKVELPMRTAVWTDAEGALVAPRTVIVADRNSELIFVEELISETPGAPYIASSLSEVFVGEGASVTAVAVQAWSAGAYSFRTHRAVVERDGRFRSLVASFGGAVTKASVDVVLRGPGAHSQLYGIVYGSEAEHFDHCTLQDHTAPHTTSTLLYRTALAGRSRSVYSGLIRVHPEAVGADAYQANRNLLLSLGARADSMPQLEIQTDDVRCTHGATIGPVEEEQVFYLMSRGIPRVEAERLIAVGFFEDVLGALPSDDVRGWVRAHLLSAMDR
ncbi:MAG: Fe-S cluster assembly protein SufD [Armatimonadota bacterium]